MVSNPPALLVSSSSRERRALVASALGWMLDGIDITLNTMVIRELLRALALTTSDAGLLASARTCLPPRVALGSASLLIALAARWRNPTPAAQSGFLPARRLPHVEWR
jgi:hypothetical protein